MLQVYHIYLNKTGDLKCQNLDSCNISAVEDLDLQMQSKYGASVA